jgi:hypothetical protein
VVAICARLFLKWRKTVSRLLKVGSIPGWVPNPANIAKLTEKIKSAKSDDIDVADLLTNTAYRYEQVDGTLGPGQWPCHTKVMVQ